VSTTLSRREFFELSAGAFAMAGTAPGTTRPAEGPIAQLSAQDQWFSGVPTGRSVVRASHGMVATSQPLATQAGLDVLKRGGNAVDASIAMAAVLNVTEPHMTGVGGDAFMMIYSSKTKKLEGLNASGRAPLALSLEYFTARKITQMPTTGMEAVTVPGAFDGWVTLLDKHGTMKLADLLAPAIGYAEDGFPVMEKTAADWETGSPEAQADRRGSLHLRRQWRRAAAGRDLLSKEPGPNAPNTRSRRPRRVLPGRDCARDRRLLPEERRLSLHGGLRVAEVGMG
jgi:gamma-glutamyltranspeptidase